MDTGLEWYKHYSHAFLNGVQGLGPDLIGTLIVLLDLMYTRGGIMIRDDRHLSGVLGCSARKARSLTDELIEQGKIIQMGDQLTNKRVQQEAKSARSFRQSKSEAGRKGAESRWTCRENKSLATAEPSDCHTTEKKRSEKTKSEIIGGGGSPTELKNQIDWEEARLSAPEARTSLQLPLEDLQRIRDAAGPATDARSEYWADGALDSVVTDWIAQLQLGMDEIARVVGQTSAKASEGSIKSPSYFTQAMERAAERIRTKQKLQQSDGARKSGAVNPSESFVQRILKPSKDRGDV
ncbi:MAG: DUF1376 domain-containing protein [Pseudomonadota bacterium]